MSDDPLPPLIVPARFCGPAGSGNGGYTCGSLAARIDSPAVRVTLRQPPPLDVRMTVTRLDGSVRASFGGAFIAEAEPATLDVDPIDPVSWAVAAETAGDYAGWGSHPFPSCFTCGTDRSAPDALALRPGPVPGRPDTTASAWSPDPSLVPGDGDGDDGTGDGTVPPEVVWAALDCPGGWAAALADRPAMLGRMTAQVDVRPLVGDRCVVMGRLLGRERRKAFTATTLYDGDGRVMARAHAVWIEIDPARRG